MDNPWSSTYSRPIVDGKVLNPQTNLAEPATGEVYSGPPSVDAIWINMFAESDFTIFRGSYIESVDQIFVEVAKHIRQGSYEIVSVCATPYAITVVCKCHLSLEGFLAVIRTMFEEETRNEST